MSKKKKTPEELAVSMNSKQRQKEELARKRQEAEARRAAQKAKSIEELLSAAGTVTEDDFWEYIWSESEEIDRKELGFLSSYDAYSAFIARNEDEPDCAVVNEYNGKYFLWVRGANYGQDWIVDTPLEDVRVFDSKEEAVSAMNAMPYGDRPISEIISEVKEEVDDPGIWIDVQSDSPGYYYNLKYFRNLLLEKYSHLDADTVREAIAHYKSFEKKYADAGLTIYSLYKAPREWNSNQRYFVIEVGNSFCQIEKKVHIQSSMQHRPRIVCDYFTGKVFDEVLAEAKKLDEETRPSREYEEARRKEKDRFNKEHGEGQIGKEELKQLFPYLEEKLGPMLENCDGTLRFSREFLHAMYNDKEKELAAEIYLEHHGGYCDCEVLLNIAPEEEKDNDNIGR